MGTIQYSTWSLVRGHAVGTKLELRGTPDTLQLITLMVCQSSLAEETNRRVMLPPFVPG
jgi:hypothetical protein